LRVSADYFRSFLATSTDVFVEYDASFRCLSINPAGSTMLALAPEAIVGKTNQELLVIQQHSLTLPFSAPLRQAKKPLLTTNCSCHKVAASLKPFTPPSQRHQGQSSA
jgi:PAS domain-containing protein